MEGFTQEGESFIKLLDLIPKRTEKWERELNGLKSTGEKELELRLGPPGDEDWLVRSDRRSGDHPLLSLGHYAVSKCAQKKPITPPPSITKSPLPNSSQKRSAPGPVVGWPPVRSFRKNLASNSFSKHGSDSQALVPNKDPSKKPAIEAAPSKKGLFVKINMDGVPIGRKVDLNSFDSYEKLSAAVDLLFRGLLAAQRDCPSTLGFIKNQEAEKPITGLLDGSGEYTLVYEDNEGDRMLVGDVPWHMFVSTVKRLRVLKSSELSAINLGSGKMGKKVD